MSMELIAIISVGVTLAGLILNGQRYHRKEIETLGDKTGSEFKAVRVELQAQREETRSELQANREETRSEFQAQREVITGLLERMARLEGLLEGLREAITGRRVAEETGKYDPR